MDKRDETCCFTGHRVIARADAALLRPRLREAIRALYGRGVRYFGAGGALGFDTVAAEVHRQAQSSATTYTWQAR